MTTTHAWIEFERRVIYAAHSPGDSYEPHSAVTRLIQGVYERYPTQWRTILRRRIYADYRASAMCRAMVKVAAKRLTDEQVAGVGAEWEEVGAPTPGTLLDPADVARAWGRELPTEEPDFMRATLALAASVPRTGPRHAVARPIAATLVSAEGTIIGAAVHAGAVNRTRHAEVELIQGLWRRSRCGIPAGARLFTTLQPCRMCAAMILHATAEPALLRVYFAAADPGPMARHTAFDGAACRVALLAPG